MKIVHRKGLGFIVVFTTICSVVELLIRGIDFSNFKDMIYHSIGSDDSLILIYILLSIFLYYIVYLRYRENRGFDDYDKNPKVTEIILFQGLIKDGRQYQLSLKYSEENGVCSSSVTEKTNVYHFWISDQTYQLKRTMTFQSDTPLKVFLRNLRVKIDYLIRNENDIMNGLYDHFLKTLKLDVSKSFSINKRKGTLSENFDLKLSDPTFETEQLVVPPKEIKKEVLLDKSWKEDDYKKGNRLTLSHFDNGQVKLDGHDYFYSDERDQEFEYWMTVLKDDVPVFLEILKQVDEPNNVQQILELCEKKNIEPHFVSWSS